MNTELIKLFANGRDLLQQGDCSAVRPLVNQIISLMTVPLVQGSLRYAYKNSGAAQGASAKNAAEGATFSAAVLPLVHYCNTASSAVVSANLKFGLFPDGGAVEAARYSDFTAVKAALEDVYACLGITCDMVGALADGTGTAYAGMEKCTPPEKIISISPFSVTVLVTAAGSVSDYGPSVLAALECMMAGLAKVRTLNLILPPP